MTQKQKSGDDSTNLLAGRDININSNIVLYSIEEVSKKLLSSVFGELPENTKRQIENNQRSYFQELSERLIQLNKETDEIKKIMESPDFQYISKKAGISASRSPSKELHDNLASLIIKRINHDTKDLQKIIYNEAILTVEKLTKNQFKILTFFFLITRTKAGGVKNSVDFINYIRSKIIPFMDFKITQIEIDHLAYTDCASFSIAGRELNGFFKNNYPEIFKKEDNIEEIFSDNLIYSQLKNTWTNPISNMNITSVGIALAINYYEQIIKEQLNADEWLASN